MTAYSEAACRLGLCLCEEAAAPDDDPDDPYLRAFQDTYAHDLPPED